MANFEESEIDFSRSPLLCGVKMALPPKNTLIIRLMSLFGSYILGFFFMSKYKSLMTLMMNFSFANDKYTRFFFLTS